MYLEKFVRIAIHERIRHLFTYCFLSNIFSNKEKKKYWAHLEISWKMTQKHATFIKSKDLFVSQKCYLRFSQKLKLIL